MLRPTRSIVPEKHSLRLHSVDKTSCKLRCLIDNKCVYTYINRRGPLPNVVRVWFRYANNTLNSVNSHFSQCLAFDKMVSQISIHSEGSWI